MKELSSTIFSLPFADYRAGECTPAAETNEVLITLHRRENMPHIGALLAALVGLARENPQLAFRFPVHPAPALLQAVRQLRQVPPNWHTCPPLSAADFYRALRGAQLVISDSGGVQEECLLCGKRLLVVRRVSERRTDFPFTAAVPPDGERLREGFYRLLSTPAPEKGTDWYGAGGAAKAIAEILAKAQD